MKTNSKESNVPKLRNNDPRSPVTAKDILKDRLKILIIIFVIYLPFHLLHIGCPIKFITGISCPGCGMTRAVLSALTLQFQEAFYYHPLFWLSPIMIFLYLFEGYLKKGIVKISGVLIVSVFLIIYIIRLFILQNDVVKIDTMSGFMIKLIHYIVVGGYK